MNTFPPPTTPTPAPRKSRRLGLILGVSAGGLAVAAAAIGVTLTATGAFASTAPITTTTIPPTTTEAPESVRVVYSMSVMGEWCDDVENTYDDDWGYDDVAGMEFQIRDENDKIIGHGELPLSGTDTDYSCDFTAEVIEVEAADLYQIGNDDRGWVTWDQDDVASGKLIAEAEL